MKRKISGVSSVNKKVKQTVPIYMNHKRCFFLCLRELSSFKEKRLTLLFNNRYRFKCKTASVQPATTGLEGKIIVEWLNEILSGKQNIALSAHDKELLIEKVKTKVQDETRVQILVEWILEKLTYWDYTCWDESYTLSVLRYLYGEQMESLQDAHIDGKFIDDIVTLVMNKTTRKKIYDTLMTQRPELKSIPLGPLCVLMNWIEIYLVTPFTVSTVLEFLEMLEMSGDQVKPYETCDTVIPNEDAVHHVKVNTFLHSSIYNQAFGIKGSGKSSLINQIPDIIGNVVQSNKKVSESFSIIDIRVNCSVLLPKKKDRSLDYYFLARIFHSFISHVKPFQWPNTTGLNDEGIIQQITRDIKEFSLDSITIAKSLWEWLKKQADKDLWLNVTFENLDCCCEAEYKLVQLIESIKKFWELPNAFRNSCFITMSSNVNDFEDCFRTYNRSSIDCSLNKDEMSKFLELLGLDETKDEMLKQVLKLLVEHTECITLFAKQYSQNSNALMSYQTLCEEYTVSNTTPEKAESEIYRMLRRGSALIPIPKLKHFVDVIIRNDPNHPLKLLESMIGKWYIPNSEMMKPLFQLTFFVKQELMLRTELKDKGSELLSGLISRSAFPKNVIDIHQKCKLVHVSLELLDFNRIRYGSVYCLSDDTLFDVIINVSKLCIFKLNSNDYEQDCNRIDLFFKQEKGLKESDYSVFFLTNDKNIKGDSQRFKVILLEDCIGSLALLMRNLE